jgi:hypothetical protein
VGGVLQYFQRGYWRNFHRNGRAFTLASNGNDTYLNDILMYGGTQTPANMPEKGLDIQNTQAIYAQRVSVLAFQIGCHVHPIGAQFVTWGFFNDATFDTCAARAIQIEPGAGSKVIGLNFVDSWAATSKTYEGVYIGGPGRADGIQFTALRAINNNLSGVQVTGSTVKNIFFDDSIISGNNGASNGSVGISFVGGVTDFAVRNCKVGAAYDFGPSQYAGVYVASGCTDYIITSNNLRGNTNTGLSDLGGAVNKVVANNL